MLIKNVKLADRNQQVMIVHVNAVRALPEEHRCRTYAELARDVGIFPGTILHILRKKLKMRKNLRSMGSAQS